MATRPMPQAMMTEAVAAFEAAGGVLDRAAAALNIPRSTMQNRISRARQSGMIPEPMRIEVPGRLHLDVMDGVVLVGSDAHYWPGVISTAHRAFVRACELLKPVAVVMNGDMLDGASISRHPPIGWESRPGLVNEIEACKDRLGEIVKATLSKKTRRFWPLGNHDARFETRLATVAPEYAKINGIHLRDHFVDFEACWSIWVNNDVVIKHRNRGGIHAAHNNTLWAGKTIVTGHLHSLKVTPLNDYNGPRWGVDTGTMADPFGDQFSGYMEDNPRSWRSGFVVLTFHNGRLLWPEICHVISQNEAEFRGKVYSV